MPGSKRKGWVVPLLAFSMAAIFLLVLLFVLGKLPALFHFIDDVMPGRH